MINGGNARLSRQTKDVKVTSRAVLPAVRLRFEMQLQKCRGRYEYRQVHGVRVGVRGVFM